MAADCPVEAAVRERVAVVDAFIGPPIRWRNWSAQLKRWRAGEPAEGPEPSHVAA